MRPRYVPLSLCLPRRLFLLPKRHLRNQFRCRPAALSVSLSRYGRQIFFFFTSENESLPKFRNIITLSPKRFSFSLPCVGEIPREYTLRREEEGDGGCWLRELFYEFCHAHRRDALPAGSPFVFVAQGPVAPSFLKQYNLRNLVVTSNSFSSLASFSIFCHSVSD